MESTLMPSDPAPAPAREDPLLQIEGLSLSFGGLKVLDDVSMSVRRGSIVGIVGPNGAGKSSLLNCATGAYRAQGGTVRVAGVDVLRRSPSSIAQLGVSRTFQAVQLVRDYTVEQNVMIGRHLKVRRNLLAAMAYIGPSRRQERSEKEAVGEILEAVGMAGRGQEKVGNLSYGDQRRVEIARAIAAEPALLFLDEPTSGMGAAERATIGELLASLTATRSLTQVLIEHDVNFVAGLCERVVVLDFGKVIAEGPPEVVFADPRVIEAYVGV
jgi:branched-chain amino acid transport system ATP-binding protein